MTTLFRDPGPALLLQRELLERGWAAAWSDAERLLSRLAGGWPGWQHAAEARLALLRGDAARALRAAKESREQALQGGLPPELALPAQGLVMAALEAGEPAQARRWLDEGARFDGPAACFEPALRARLAAAEGDRAACSSFAAEAGRLLDAAAPGPEIAVPCRRLVVGALLEAGETEAALAQARRLCCPPEAPVVLRHAAAFWRGRAFDAAGLRAEADEACREALACGPDLAWTAELRSRSRAQARDGAELS